MADNKAPTEAAAQHVAELLASRRDEILNLWI